MEVLVACQPDGSVSFLAVPPELAALLLELPGILDDDDRPEVQSRRYQDPTDDAAANAEWQRMMRDELVHLFGEARDVVARDLEGLVATRDEPTGARLDIPAAHLSAWISALQIARVSLGAAHGLDQEPLDLGAELFGPDERADAALRIHAYGNLQGLLLEVAAPDVTERGPGADEDGPEGGRPPVMSIDFDEFDDFEDDDELDEDDFDDDDDEDDFDDEDDLDSEEE